jgi:hypothetical protein
MAVKEATSASGRVTHLDVGERRAQGSQAAGQTPPSSHSGWQPTVDRPDPVGLLEEQDRTREPDLVPEEYEEFVKAIRSGRLEAVEGV